MSQPFTSDIDSAHAPAVEPRARSARSYIVLSIVAALFTITLKSSAYLLTGSVGLLSDAAESLINLAAAVVAFWLLTVAARPADEEHSYGHSKAEYFSSGVESSLILLAAVGIGVTAFSRLFSPQPLENVGIGIAVSLVATGINGVVAVVLLRAGRRIGSITLTADAHHLLTDVWTSVGVLVGVVLVQLTGWLVLDPVIALLVASNIVWIGFRLLRDSALGLLDTALPRNDREAISQVTDRYQAEGIRFHALRTRMAGQRKFISMHVLVPGSWSVQRGHALCEQIEQAIIQELPRSTVFTHLEPLEDPVSFQDQGLDRTGKADLEAPHPVDIR